MTLTTKAYLQGVVQHYKTQTGEGRIFLHGDPVGSAAWRTNEMQELRKPPGVKTLELDLCIFAGGKNVPSKGPMKFVTNSKVLERDLKKRCDMLHDHRGGGGGASQREYPDALLKVICRSILN